MWLMSNELVFRKIFGFCVGFKRFLVLGWDDGGINGKLSLILNLIFLRV